MKNTDARHVVFTADDFGLHRAVNEAVEAAHRDGLLVATSLMVGAPAAHDAVERARMLPTLAVGLHIVLADGKAVLPPAAIPDLVDENGYFDDRMARAGIRFFFRPRVRRQLAAEIRAQFAAFAATGLPLDHVNAHKHFHLHPTILSRIIKIGRDYGLKAVRLPREPLIAGLRITRRRAASRVLGRIFLAPWLAMMRLRLQRANLAHNDHIFGLSVTGGLDENTLLRILQLIPRGVSEIYFHPANRNGLTPLMADYRHTDELNALLSPHARTLLAACDLQLVRFSQLSRPRGRKAP